jgi:cell division septum initiation protein DivIVA
MDETGVLALVDELSDLIEDGKSVLGNRDRKQIEAGAALDILDEIRQSFPVEFAEARKIIRESQSLREDAEVEANRIIEDARQQALLIASEQEIVRIAQQQAETILADARDQEREVRAGAEDFADNVFAHVESTLTELAGQASRCRERLNSRSFR